uniref:YveK family protein n=2 Tax=Faecalibaculum rodentium TaxID=1702221 RepID=UPI0025B03060
VGAVVAGGLTWALIPKTYAASGTLFLTPRVQEGEIDINSLNSNQKLVNNVINLLTQDNIMSMVAQETGMASSEEVRDALSITNTDNTEIITVTATTEDPKLSKEIATTTINTFIDTMKDSLNVQNIQITDQPKLSYEPVGPSIKKNAAIGGLAGLVLGLGFLVIHMLTDKRLKTREEAEKYLGLPVYAELPDLEKK